MANGIQFESAGFDGVEPACSLGGAVIPSVDDPSLTTGLDVSALHSYDESGEGADSSSDAL